VLNAKQKNAKSKAKAYFFGPEAIAAMMGSTVSTADEGFKNIVGIGVGPKSTGGAITHQDSIHVYVRMKTPKSQLPAHQEVPPKFGSLPTDVIEVGDITACQTTSTFNRRNRNRPVVS